MRRQSPSGSACSVTVLRSFRLDTLRPPAAQPGPVQCVVTKFVYASLFINMVLPLCKAEEYSNRNITIHKNQSMKLLLLYLSFPVSLLAPSALLADDAELLAGKWSVNKTEQGQKITQPIEIKKDKFTFEILNDGQPPFHPKGHVKFANLAPFS